VNQRLDVALRRVDVTDFGQVDMALYLPGCPGVPVLDVYGADGRLIVRLVGEDAFGFRKFLAPPRTPP